METAARILFAATLASFVTTLTLPVSSLAEGANPWYYRNETHTWCAGAYRRCGPSRASNRRRHLLAGEAPSQSELTYLDSDHIEAASGGLLVCFVCFDRLI